MAALDSQMPTKRQKTFATQDDYVSLDHDSHHQSASISTPHAPRRPPPHAFRPQQDRPKSKHVLPGCEPWLLVKTKLRRRFVHNPDTKQSLWRIPAHVLPAVLAWEQSERDEKEKADNAAWAEQQLQQMRPSQAQPSPIIGGTTEASTSSGRRRRSVSLQREDEAALMAELAAQTDHNSAPLPAQSDPHSAPAATYGYDSDGSYEEVEVTDDEDEQDKSEERPQEAARVDSEANGEHQQHSGPEPAEPDAPVEFGEDDIAWQLAAMGEDYGLDEGEYGDEPDEGWEEGAEGLGLTAEDAQNLFRDLLDDYRVSPFTPWDKIISDETENSILNDDRYTVLSTMKARREAYDAWARDRAAQIQAERAATQKSNPKIPYLAFLQEKASPKLYWPEFKRKYKREAEMNDRKLSDKDREKLYRDHIARLKMSESARQSDLQSLLKSVPLTSLNAASTVDNLPEQVLSHLHYIGLPVTLRDTIVAAHLQSLPAVTDEGSTAGEGNRMTDRKDHERRRREQALAAREAHVRNERRAQEKLEERARRDLREGERELERAMAYERRNAPP
ncbi:putative FF domain, pre-mRNA-processing factor Prp40 [Septoria linicola]|nr:putative FF domain, pre-mRNA-processing factor Prp40 [Septoria linicola]